MREKVLLFYISVLTLLSLDNSFGSWYGSVTTAPNSTKTVQISLKWWNRPINKSKLSVEVTNYSLGREPIVKWTILVKVKKVSNEVWRLGGKSEKNKIHDLWWEALGPEWKWKGTSITRPIPMQNSHDAAILRRKIKNIPCVEGFRNVLYLQLELYSKIILLSTRVNVLTKENLMQQTDTLTIMFRVKTFVHFLFISSQI